MRERAIEQAWRWFLIRAPAMTGIGRGARGQANCSGEEILHNGRL